MLQTEQSENNMDDLDSLQIGYPTKYYRNYVCVWCPIMCLCETVQCFRTFDAPMHPRIWGTFNTKVPVLGVSSPIFWQCACSFLGIRNSYSNPRGWELCLDSQSDGIRWWAEFDRNCNIFLAPYMENQTFAGFWICKYWKSMIYMYIELQSLIHQ